MSAKRTDSKLLLVEGVDEEYVVNRLCEHHNFTGKFGVVEKKGFPELKKAIRPEAKVSRRVALGILVDANDNPAGRWDSVTYQLRRLGLDTPPQMASTGTVIDGTGGMPRVGIWLMPNNRCKGELEDFIQGLIPEGDPIWPLASSYIEGIPAGERKFKSQKAQRARIHAWLAAREEPRRMGEAILAKDLDANAESAKHFVGWLRRLFG